MKVVALVSGGKDSCYAMMKCIQYGHEIVALANLMPVDDSVDELDSYMYQTVGHQIVVSYAKCMGLPLYRRRLQGSTRNQSLSYKMTPGDEVEDMFILLSEVKRQIPSISAVSSGAIASDYQRLRVESVSARLGLVSLAYLWKQDQSLLLKEMITNGIIAVIIKVAAIGLDPSKHLGKEITHLESHLHHLNELYGINVCGEGGEYETLTLDCPLFMFARIVLDDFQVVLHSSDSIAPVGVLHPLAFHLEPKDLPTISSGSNLTVNVCPEEMNCVHEVQGDCLQLQAEPSKSFDSIIDPIQITSQKFCMSKRNRDDIFSICCWLQDCCRTPTGLQDALRGGLWKIESQLIEHGFGWENVLYIHLYISDMDEFAMANDTYVSFITQEKCRFGVPSRSTIELPLFQVGLGRAYIEVLVSRDLTKRVLHVQSISCWAPSCIGPYSQATLHKGILYMAGQLGLDPPTMTLCKGGPVVELEQALVNSEAVAKCFNCSISTCAVVFVIYCSTHIPSSERTKVQKKQEVFLEQLKTKQSDRGTSSTVLDPVVLFVLVPDLPKKALVEVKPILNVEEGMETEAKPVVRNQSCIVKQGYWGFQHEFWHDVCLQKCVVVGKFCGTVVSITDELAAKICRQSLGADEDGSDHQFPITEGQMDKVAKFCIYLIDRVLVENLFTWKDAVYLRIYFQTSLSVPMEKLSLVFTNTLREFAKLNPTLDCGNEAFFNMIPVLGSGRSAMSMDALITCELLAQKPTTRIESLSSKKRGRKKKPKSPLYFQLSDASTQQFVTVDVAPLFHPQ
ncbi:hypothetical protein Nepgr_001411 [Nepenthes gracilis]|uniref:Diphthine--ammonia ligase n=1 Tax=Nepenthes gracilis TaxID=150966 RepID=A0AAD3P8H0_NEPGR|nr:hypothetical protein Nepgr_001411 [Nepenthes gracilis]